MKSNKGFTLLELLAVIVVLAIIALIVTPFVTEAINEAKEGAARNTGYGIVSAAELYYAQEMAKQGGTFYETTVTFNGAASIVTPFAEGVGQSTTFEFKGTIPEAGKMVISANGEVTFGTDAGEQVKVNGQCLELGTDGAVTTTACQPA